MQDNNFLINNLQKRKFLYAGAFVVFLLILFIFFKYQPHIFREKKTDNTKIVDQTLAILNKKQIQKYPNIVFKNNASLELLPKELSVFILPNHKNLIVNKLKFENENDGFDIKYVVDGNLYDVFNNIYKSVTNSKFWNTVGWTRGNAAGLMEFVSPNITSENNIENWMVKVVLTTISNRDTEINILLVFNKIK
jgi:hypothetical protein